MVFSRSPFTTADGGLSWREEPIENTRSFESTDFASWRELSASTMWRIDETGALLKSVDGGSTSELAMQGWRIGLARSVFRTPWGLVASGPGGCYRTHDGETWEELKLWPENETGAADFLHAYWMGRHYGFIDENI